MTSEIGGKEGKGKEKEGEERGEKEKGKEMTVRCFSDKNSNKLRTLKEDNRKQQNIGNK